MLDEDLKYLKDALGLDVEAKRWPEVDSLPLYLRSAATVFAVEAGGASFLLVRPVEDATLPDVKRLYAQLLKRSHDIVVVSVPTANARQRKALVAQGVPFICAGRQAFLPFLGVASTEWGKAGLEARRRVKLTPKAQQAAIWGALRGGSYTLSELRAATGMSASQASGALRELSDRGMAARAKNGKTVIVTPIGTDELLGEHMGSLSSPRVRSMHVKRGVLVEALPDAGESALAARGTLNPPPICQKAVDRTAAKELEPFEVLDGELPDCETVLVQIWRYSPLFVGSDEIDEISLGLSLAGGDERIEEEIYLLFGKEYPWRKAL